MLGVLERGLGALRVGEQDEAEAPPDPGDPVSQHHHLLQLAERPEVLLQILLLRVRRDATHEQLRSLLRLRQRRGGRRGRPSDFRRRRRRRRRSRLHLPLHLPLGFWLLGAVAWIKVGRSHTKRRGIRCLIGNRSLKQRTVDKRPCSYGNILTVHYRIVNEPVSEFETEKAFTWRLCYPNPGKLYL